MKKNNEPKTEIVPISAEEYNRLVEMGGIEVKYVCTNQDMQNNRVTIQVEWLQDWNEIGKEDAEKAIKELLEKEYEPYTIQFTPPYIK